jgi:iron complex outermembrane receptor protein
VDNNDNISVNGQSGVLIMIDGRTSYMSATDAGEYLKSLDASQIEKIEIITNPSAKYDASGNTIINIVRKKNKNTGLNTELTSGYSQGIYGRGNEGISLNYGAKKWNIFANYGYNFGNYYSYYGGTTKFSSNNQIQSIFIDTNLRSQQFRGNTGRFEADYMPDKKQTIGFVFELSQNEGTVYKDFPNKMYGENSQLDSSLSMQGNRTYSRINTSYGVNYDYKIDSTGKDLSANIDYASYSNNFSELDVTSYYDSLGLGLHSPTALLFSLPRTINIWAAKTDYEQPMGKNGTFESGLKVSYVSSNNNALYWNVINGTDAVDTTFTNDFIYTEYIYAGYVSYARKLGRRFYFKVGLRGEETQDKGVQLVHDTTFTHNYFSLFPNALITYKLDTNNTLKLSYRRRIWRPDYSDLNPFVYFNNLYSYYVGNPALQPQISNAGYVEEQFKQLGSISFGDEYWTNAMNDNVVQNNITHVTYSIPTNSKTYNNLYVKVESTIPITKWFTTMNTVLFMQQQWQGDVEGSNYSNAGFTWSFNSVNMITVNKNWSGEVDFNYNAQGVFGPQVTGPSYYLEIGIKRLFAHERGTITLNCSDVLLSDHYFYSENFQGVNFNNFEYYDSRRLRLTITWKLGKTEHDRQQKDKAADDEMNRVKN